MSTLIFEHLSLSHFEIKKPVYQHYLCYLFCVYHVISHKRGENFYPMYTHTHRRHFATKTFLALRVFVNDEMNELYHGIVSTEQVLKPGGRLCLITFQSAEDRVAKRALRRLVVADEQVETAAKTSATTRHWTKFMTFFPLLEEVEKNKRSRSATLRVATKTI